MSTQHFLIRGKHFGTAERTVGDTPLLIRGEPAPPHGEAFFCPICTELWAQCPVEGEPSTVHISPCDKHHPGEHFGSWSLGAVSPYQVPGSLMLSYDATWNNSLPLPILVREFHLHLNHKGIL